MKAGNSPSKKNLCTEAFKFCAEVSNGAPPFVTNCGAVKIQQQLIGQKRKHEALDSAWLQSGGSHKWSLKVDCDSDSKSCDVLVGVIAKVESLHYETYMGEQTGEWYFYGGDGSMFNNGKLDSQDDSLRLKKGSKVTLLLDLTGDGTLSVSIDGGTPRQLSSGMLSEADSLGTSPGFLPAVSISNQTDRIEFLGFE